MNTVLTLSATQKLVATVVTLGTILLSSGGGYLVFKGVTDYRITDFEKRLTKVEDHGSDRIAGEISVQSREIQALAEALRQDHDSIIKVVTILDEQMRRIHPDSPNKP